MAPPAGLSSSCIVVSLFFGCSHELHQCFVWSTTESILLSRRLSRVTRIVHVNGLLESHCESDNKSKSTGELKECLSLPVTSVCVCVW